MNPNQQISMERDQRSYSLPLPHTLYHAFPPNCIHGVFLKIKAWRRANIDKKNARAWGRCIYSFLSGTLVNYSLCYTSTFLYHHHHNSTFCSLWVSSHSAEMDNMTPRGKKGLNGQWRFFPSVIVLLYTGGTLREMSGLTKGERSRKAFLPTAVPLWSVQHKVSGW